MIKATTLLFRRYSVVDSNIDGFVLALIIYDSLLPVSQRNIYAIILL